eukprot:gene11476-12672_t
MEYFCVSCKKEVHPRQEAIECNECKRWQHRTCKSGVSREDYRRFNREEIEIDWKCEDCRDGRVTVFDRTEHNGLSSSSQLDISFQVAAESTRTDDVSLCVRTPFAVPVPVSEEPMEDDPLPEIEIQINWPEDTERCNQVVEAEIVAEISSQECEKTVGKQKERVENESTDRSRPTWAAAREARQKTHSLRKPEAIALNRVIGLNKTSVQNNFKNLQELLDTHNFDPHQIINCDETEITCVNKPVKVIALKGNRVVASVTSGERGQTTTIICAISATDAFAPPLMIFKRKRVHPELIERAPPGTIGGVSDSGWVDTDLFLKFLKHFATVENADLKSATVENAVSGFKTTGIHPFNTDNIPDSEYLQDPREAGSKEDRAATMEPTSGPSNQRIEATQNQHHATTMEPTPGPSNESLDLFVITSTASTSDPELELSFDKILSVPKIVAK